MAKKGAWPKKAWPKRTWPIISQLQHKIKSFVWVSTSDIRLKKVFWLEVFKYTVIYLTFDRKGVARDYIFAGQPRSFCSKMLPYKSMPWKITLFTYAAGYIGSRCSGYICGQYSGYICSRATNVAATVATYVAGYICGCYSGYIRSRLHA